MIDAVKYLVRFVSTIMLIYTGTYKVLLFPLRIGWEEGFTFV